MNRESALGFVVVATILIVVSWTLLTVLGALKSFVVDNAWGVGLGLIVFAGVALFVAAKKT